MNVRKHSTQKPRVSTSAIERMLLRHAFAITPESRLFVAVIGQALHDMTQQHGHYRRRARHFFNTRGLDNYAELIGLEPEFVREIARKTGYLDNKPNSTQAKRKAQDA